MISKEEKAIDDEVMGREYFFFTSIFSIEFCVIIHRLSLA